MTDVSCLFFRISVVLSTGLGTCFVFDNSISFTLILLAYFDKSLGFPPNYKKRQLALSLGRCKDRFLSPKRSAAKIATLILCFAKLLYYFQPTVMSLVLFIWCPFPWCQSYPEDDTFDMPVRKRKSYAFLLPLTWDINSVSWKSLCERVTFCNIPEVANPKVVKFVLSHVFQGINLGSLEPPLRKFFPQKPNSADLEMSNSMSICGWVGSPLLGCEESHLPCLKADRRVSVPCHMPDSLLDWEFQEKIGFSRENINFNMTGKVTRLQNELCVSDKIRNTKFCSSEFSL